METFSRLLQNDYICRCYGTEPIHQAVSRPDEGKENTLRARLRLIRTVGHRHPHPRSVSTSQGRRP